MSKPELISFFCEIAPASGGMTPVIDMERVLQKLPESVKARFQCGILTSMNMSPDDKPHLDIRRGGFLPCRSWTKLDAGPVEAAKRAQATSKEELRIEWFNGWLQPFRPMRATEVHHGKRVWTGFFPLFHPWGTVMQGAFDVVLHNRTWRQLRTWIALASHLALWSLANVLQGIPVMKPRLSDVAGPSSLSCKLQDGTSIGILSMFHIIWAYNTTAVKWPWQPGQFVLLDNRRLGHMRTPYDPSSRSIYTAFGSRKASL